jgi:hypothetical protein
MLVSHMQAGHLPAKQVAVNAIISDRMQQLGKAIEDGESIVLDHVILGRLQMDRYFTGLAKGEVIPSTSEIIQVMKMFAQIEAAQTAPTVDTAVYNQVISVMIDAVKAVAPDEFDIIMHRVSENPVIKGLMVERQKQAERLAIGAG